MKTIYDSDWYRFRRKYLSRPENQICAGCGRSIWSSRDHRGRLLPPNVDHKVRIRDGGAKYDESNLQPMCHSCHSAKSGLETLGRLFKGCDPSGLPRDPMHHWNME